MENNTAFVATLKNIRPIEGADKIKLADVMLNDIPITQIVVGHDTHEGVLVVYFDSNMALEDEVIEALDKVSVGYGTEGFTSVGKYLAKGNRVKVVKFNKFNIISNGLAIEIAKFFQFFNSDSEAIKTLVEGFNFTEIGDVKICHKWLPPVRNQSQGTGKKPNRRGQRGLEFNKFIDGQFRFHCDTTQMQRAIHEINPTDVVSLSNKLHGCVSENSIIETLEFGTKTIREVVNNKIQCHIKAFNTCTKEIVFAPIDEFYYKEDDGDWYEIELEDGTKLEITGNNPIWLPQLSCYRKVEDLIVGDTLLTD